MPRSITSVDIYRLRLAAVALHMQCSRFISLQLLAIFDEFSFIIAGSRPAAILYFDSANDTKL